MSFQWSRRTWPDDAPENAAQDGARFEVRDVRGVVFDIGRDSLEDMKKAREIEQHRNKDASR